MEKQKIPIGRVDIPEDKANWLRSVNKEGIVFIIPPGGQKYTPVQRKAVDEAVKKVQASFVKRAESLRAAERSALKELRKDPEDANGKLRSAYKKAKEELQLFVKERRAATVQAKREAREKALK